MQKYFWARDKAAGGECDMTDVLLRTKRTDTGKNNTVVLVMVVGDMGGGCGGCRRGQDDGGRDGSS